MRRGDLVVKMDWENKPTNLFGILLDVRIEQTVPKKPFEVPWRYTVLWSDCTVKEHSTGAIARIALYKWP